MSTNDPIWSYGETKISLGSPTVEEPTWSYGESYSIGEITVPIIFGNVIVGGLTTN